jgi:hypothetical protein
MTTKPTYFGAVGSAVAQSLLTGAWVASGELPRSKRRAVRGAATAAVVVSGWYASAKDDREISYTVGEGLVIRTPDGTEVRRPVRPRSAIATGATAVFGLGMIVGRRELEKRWLARLQRNGHHHPHRALALRMGLLTLAGALPGRLIAAREAQRKGL